MYLSLFPLLFTSLLFSTICKASSANHFAFLLLFFFGMVLFACTILLTSVHSSSGTLLTKSSPLNLFVMSTVNSYGIWFKSYLGGLLFYLVFSNLSLNFALRSWWSELQLATGLVICWLYTASTSLATKNVINFDFSIDHLVMSLYKVVSCVVDKESSLWLVHSLGRIQLTFALIHFGGREKSWLGFKKIQNILLDGLRE